MHKNTLWFILALVCVYLTLVYCEEQQQQENDTDLQDNKSVSVLQSDDTDLQEEGRTRRRHRHHLYHMWGWHALAIAYLVKVKVVIVAFFVGSAIWLGFRYLWPHKCNTEIILDHPPPSFSHHDHIPYSLDHSEHYSEHPHFAASSFSDVSSSPGASFDPYSAYSSSYGGGDVVTDTSSSETHTFRKKREVQDEQSESESEDVDEPENEQARQIPMATEEQIGNIMFSFLGLDTKACRRRFICEMEFRSKLNPLTALAFRVMGRSFFAQYTNDHNELGQAHSFEECAAVNAECVFIENDQNEQEENNVQEEESNADVMEKPETEPTDDDIKDESSKDQENSIDNNDVEERENYKNIQAERRNAYRRRVRGDRHLSQ